MNNQLLRLLATSFFALFILSSQVHANIPGNVSVTAFFDNGVRSPAEVDLFYDKEYLANISLYGSTVYAISWFVNKEWFDCQNFEDKKSHLVVKKNGYVIKASAYSCEDTYD